jgi:hypothetical protein
MNDQMGVEMGNLDRIRTCPCLRNVTEAVALQTLLARPSANGAVTPLREETVKLAKR